MDETQTCKAIEESRDIRDFIEYLREVSGQKHVDLDIETLDALLIRVEGIIENQARRIQLLEIDMGRAADAINQQNTTISGLNTQLSTAQANAYDAADLAAINGVLGAPVSPPPATNTGSGSLSGTNGAPVGQIDLSNPPAANGSAGATA
jgi:hypothetical protein